MEIIKLTLIDDDQKKEIIARKKKLIICSPYFRNLFHFMNKNEIIMQKNEWDIHVMYDLIQFLINLSHDKTPWPYIFIPTGEYALQLYYCYRFLLLEEYFDMNIFNQFEITNDAFDDLVHLMTENPCDALVKSVNKNLPFQYKLNHLPTVYKKRMIEMTLVPYLAIYGCDHLDLYNISSQDWLRNTLKDIHLGKFIPEDKTIHEWKKIQKWKNRKTKIDFHDRFVKNIYICKDIMILIQSYLMIFYHIIHKEIIKEVYINIYCGSSYQLNNNYFSINYYYGGENDTFIYKINNEKKEITSFSLHFPIQQQILQITLTSSGKYVAVNYFMEKNHMIEIYEIVEGLFGYFVIMVISFQENRCDENLSYNQNLKYSLMGKYLVHNFFNNSTIVYNFDNEELPIICQKITLPDSENCFNFLFTEQDEYLISEHMGYKIKIWNLKKSQLLFTFEKGYYNSFTIIPMTIFYNCSFQFHHDVYNYFLLALLGRQNPYIIITIIDPLTGYIIHKIIISNYSEFIDKIQFMVMPNDLLYKKVCRAIN
jgi:WD40 repeat protein